MRPNAGEIYVHFKGGRYVVLDVVSHHETGEPMVVYTKHYDVKYVRPLSSWNEDVKLPDGRIVKRFERSGTCDE